VFPPHVKMRRYQPKPNQQVKSKNRASLAGKGAV
jgi:hypothetical protein